MSTTDTDKVKVEIKPVSARKRRAKNILVGLGCAAMGIVLLLFSSWYMAQYPLWQWDDSFAGLLQLEGAWHFNLLGVLSRVGVVVFALMTLAGIWLFVVGLIAETVVELRETTAPDDNQERGDQAG